MLRRSPSTDVVDSSDETTEITSKTPDSVDLYDQEEKILRGRLPTFILGNRTTRPAIVTTCVTLVKEARKKGPQKAFTKDEAKALPFGSSAARSWMGSLLTDSGSGSVLAKGGRKWSLHHVIQRVLAEEVREYKNYLYEEYKQSEQYNTDIKEKGQAAPLISFQAVAVQEIIASLDSKDVERYNELASNWTTTKPAVEAQNQNAEKNLTKKAQSFCTMAYTQMNARVFMLAAYTDTGGNVVTVPLDFSEVVGETSFFREYQAVIEQSDVLASFEKFVQQEMKGGKSATDRGATSEHIRPGVRALMVLQKNNYGEPVLLSPNRVPEDKEAKRFLGDMIRAVFTGLYALAQGRPGERVSVPWKQIKTEPHRFVSSKYMTPDLHSHFGDPSQVTLDSLRAIATELYRRQKNLRKAQSDAPYFWFRAYYNKKSNSWVKSRPREVLAEVTEPDQPSRSDEPGKKSVTWTEEPQTRAGNRPVKPLPKRARSNSPLKPQGKVNPTSGTSGQSSSNNSPSQRGAAPINTAGRSRSQSRTGPFDVEPPSRSPSRGRSQGRRPPATSHSPSRRDGEGKSRSRSPTKSSASRSASPTKKTNPPSDSFARGTGPATRPSKAKGRPQIFPPARVSVSPSKKAAATRTPYPVAPLSAAYRSPGKSRSVSPNKKGKQAAKRQAPTRGSSNRPADPASADPVAGRTRSRSRGPAGGTAVQDGGALERGRHRQTKGVGRDTGRPGGGHQSRGVTAARSTSVQRVSFESNDGMDSDCMEESNSDSEDIGAEWALGQEGDDEDENRDPVEGVDYSMEEEQVESPGESDGDVAWGKDGEMTDEISEFEDEYDMGDQDEQQVSARPASAKTWALKRSGGRRVQVPVSARGPVMSQSSRPTNAGVTPGKQTRSKKRC